MVRTNTNLRFCFEDLDIIDRKTCQSCDEYRHWPEGTHDEPRECWHDWRLRQPIDESHEDDDQLVRIDCITWVYYDRGRKSQAAPQLRYYLQFESNGIDGCCSSKIVHPPRLSLLLPLSLRPLWSNGSWTASLTRAMAGEPVITIGLATRSDGQRENATNWPTMHIQRKHV